MTFMHDSHLASSRPALDAGQDACVVECTHLCRQLTSGDDQTVLYNWDHEALRTIPPGEYQWLLAMPQWQAAAISQPGNEW